MELAQLRFEVDTKQVKEASDSFDRLAESLAKVEKPAAKTALVAERLAKKQAETAEAVAKAEKAQLALNTAQERAAKTQQTASDKTKEHTSILQRQQDILEFMTQGYSRGQSSVLAYAKAAGEATDQIGEILKTQRKLIGGDPFDKSLGAAEALRNEFSVLKDVQRAYNSESELSAKQLRDLAREKIRLIERLKAEGAALSDIKAQMRELKSEYEKTALASNKITDAEKERARAQREAASAAKYLADTDARLAAAMDETNAGFDKRHTDAMVKYEKALRATGISGQELAARMLVVRSSFEKLKMKEQAQQMQYLARAMSVQMGDVAISLASGMNPLLVLIQQGDQIRGVIQQVGADTAAMQNVMRDALGQIARSFMQTGAVVGSFFLNSMKAAGESALDAGFRLLGLGISTKEAKAQLAELAATNTRAAAALKTMNVIVTGLSLTFAGLALYAGTVGVAFIQMLKAETEMTRALVSTGARFGLTKESAAELAAQMETTGGTFVEKMQAISIIAKTANIPQEALKGVAEAAINLQKSGGRAMEDTVKMFEDLGKDPLKTLSEYRMATGLVNEEDMKRIQMLIDMKDKIGAVREANKILTEAIQAEAKLQYEAMSSFGRLWTDIKNGISAAWGAVQEFAGTETVIKPVQIVLQTVAVIATEVWFAVKGIAESIGGLGALAAAVLTDIANMDTNFTMSKSVMQSINEADKARESSYKDAIARIMQEGKYSADQARQRAQEAAAARKQQADAERERVKQIEERDKKEKELKKAREDALKQHEKDLDVYQALSNAASGFNKDYQDQVASLQRLFNAGNITQEQYNSSLESLIQKQPFYNDLVKEQKEAEKEIARQKKEQEKLNKQAIKDAEATAKAVEKYRDLGIEANLDLQKQNEDLDLRLRLLGLTTEEQKRLRDEYESTAKIAKIQADLQKELQDISGDEALGRNAEAWWKAITDAQARAAQRINLVNKETAVKAAEEYQKEYDRITGSLSDAVMTALFEGGKSGSKAIRNLIIAELKKPIRIFVDAVVNTIMQPLANTLGLTAGAAGAGGAGGMASVGGRAAGTLSTALSVVSYVDAIKSAREGKWAEAIGSALGTLYGGPIMGFIGKSIGKALDKFFAGDSGTPHAGGFATANILGATPRPMESQYVIPQVQSSIEELAFGTVELLNGISRTFNKQMEYQVEAGFEYDSVDPAWGYFIIKESSKTVGRWIEQSFGAMALENVDPEKAKQEFTDKAAAVIAGAVKDIGLPAWVSEMIDALGEAPTMDKLRQTLDYISGVQTALENLGEVFDSLKNMSGEFATDLLKAFGGIENLRNMMGTFYEEFFSTEEKSAVLLKQITAAFTALNKPLPATRAEFRALVEAAMKAGDAATLAGLLSTQEAFLELSDISADSLNSAIDNLKELVDLLTSSITELRSGTASVVKMQVQAARDFIQQASIAALQGLLPDTARLGTAIETVMQSQQPSAYRSEFEMQRDRLLLANQLEGILGVAEPQLSVAEKQLTALTSIDSSILSINELLNNSALFTPVPATPSAILPSVNPETGELELNAAGGISTVADTSGGVVDELRALREEVVMLRAEVRADVTYNSKTAKILDRVTLNGDSLITTPATEVV